MSVVSPNDIKTIPERYCIGKRPLSLLLGWGELTYTRLLAGNTPSAAHAAELRVLLDDPAAFARLLVVGQDRITATAFRRSFAACDELLAGEGGALRALRIFAVADRLCHLSQGDLTPSALQRLAYYAQGVSLARLGAPLFDDVALAGDFGPAYARIEANYTFDEIVRTANAYSSPDVRLPAPTEPAGVPSTADADSVTSGEFETKRLLSKKEIAVIDDVHRVYGKYSGQELSRASCKEAPWKKARKKADAQDAAEGGDVPFGVISLKSMRKYFAKADIR